MTLTVDLRARALQFLARREYSRAELYQKLQTQCEDLSQLDAVLNDFCERGWLSDARFAEQWAHYRANRYGSRRVRQELQNKGVASELIDAVLAETSMQEEEATARSIWSRKFGQLPTTPKEKARQMRFLASRGFAYEIIYKIVGGIEDEDTWDSSL